MRKTMRKSICLFTMCLFLIAPSSGFSQGIYNSFDNSYAGTQSQKGYVGARFNISLNALQNWKSNVRFGLGFGLRNFEGLKSFVPVWGGSSQSGARFLGVSESGDAKAGSGTALLLGGALLVGILALTSGSDDQDILCINPLPNGGC